MVHSYSDWALREVPSLIAIHRHGTHDAFSETGEKSPPGNGKLSGGAWHRFLLQTHFLLQCSVQFTYECCDVLHKQELREEKCTGSEGQGKKKKGMTETGGGDRHPEARLPLSYSVLSPLTHTPRV